MARIDSLPKNTPVRLDFGGSYQEDAIFLYLDGAGDERRAHFYTRTEGESDPDGYEWEAYRFDGHWAYGSSADRLSLIAVHDHH